MRRRIRLYSFGVGISAMTDEPRGKSQVPGTVADNPSEAALVAAAARQGLREVPWLIVLTIGWIGFQVYAAVTTDSQVIRWLSYGVMAAFAGSAVKILLRDRPRLIRAERLNRELAEGTGSASTSSRSRSKPR